MTTNSIEGFHGLALKYHEKKVDLHHSHYTCKTNMAIWHKVMAYTSYYAKTAKLYKKGAAFKKAGR